MKPVDQSTFGNIGNCLSACVASIFEISISDVPNFCCIKEHPQYDRNWFTALADFMIPFGYKPRRRVHPPDGYSIINGNGPRGSRHSCVAFDGKIVHDPHPDKTGLLNITDYIMVEKIE